ncbi:MAG: hypothetical protein J7M38_01250 [Armatimonadetes bacterium]|nr:hypothetical protein [Armatimonadota bacterium]
MGEGSIDNICGDNISVTRAKPIEFAEVETEAIHLDEEEFRKILFEAFLGKNPLDYDNWRSLSRGFLVTLLNKKRYLINIRERIEKVRGEDFTLEDFFATFWEATDLLIGGVIEELEKYGIDFVVIPVKNSEEYYWATRTVLYPNADSKIMALCHKILGFNASKVNKHRVRTLLLQSSKLVHYEETLDYGWLLPLRDGRVLDLDKLMILEKVPGKYFKFRANITLNQNILDEFIRLINIEAPVDKVREKILENAPNFRKVLYNVFPEKDEELDRFEEALGTILSPCLYRRFFIVVGKRGIGKSVIADTIKEIFGKLASGHSLNFLFNKAVRWSEGEIAGKWVNVSSETTTNILIGIDQLKRITGDMILTGEVKFRRPFDFPNRVKLFFFVNDLPIFKDLDDSAIDRFYIIKAKGEPPENPDPTLRIKIIENEKNIVFLYILWCYLRLRKREFKLVYDRSFDKKAELIMEERIGLTEFIEEKCLVDESATCEGSELYNAYLEWCGEKKREPVGRNTFYNGLVLLGFKKYRRGGNIRFRGITLLREEEPLNS